MTIGKNSIFLVEKSNNLEIYNNANTIEDKSVTDPRERERLYWQSDHLRLFGRDYGDKLADAGFKVTESNYINEIDPNLVKRYALDKNEIVYFCQKS